MKSILILGANLIAIVYFILFFVDNRLLPKESLLKVRNIVFVCMLLYVSHNVLYIYILKKEKAENGLIYKVASGTKNSASRLHNYIRPFQKELLTWTLIAAGIALLSFVLLGLPGAFLLEIPQRLGMGSRIGGDNLWPAALFIAILWPFCFPLGVLVKHYLIQAGYRAYAFYGWLGTIILAIPFILGLTYLMFNKAK